MQTTLIKGTWLRFEPKNFKIFFIIFNGYKTLNLGKIIVVKKELFWVVKFKASVIQSSFLCIHSSTGVNEMHSRSVGD